MRSLHGVYTSRGVPRIASAARAGHGRGPYAVQCSFEMHAGLQMHPMQKNSDCHSRNTMAKKRAGRVLFWRKRKQEESKVKKFFKNYWFILCMLTGIVAGCITGAVWPGATCL